ncbi:MAG: carbohydrate binding family 9 domain-containing protein, partial [Acidobacteriota bacterium]|nr:carbohydrate binding family 9 domain-containing protein [Acidobacteriota bacterium]
MPRGVAFALILLILAAVPVGAQSQDAPIDGPPGPIPPAVISRDANGHATVRTMRLPSPVVLDGRLEEAFYRDVPSFGDFIQQDPVEGGPATEKTDVWVFFDQANIYVSARLWEEDKSRRVANEMRRDSFNLYNNDHFAVLFDTFYDRRNGYAFYANSLGGLGDAQLVNEQPNPNWNGLWTARTAEFEGGWTVEMRVPFRSMRFKEGGHVWGINFRRLVRWNNESDYLTSIPQSWGRRGLTKASSAGTLVGIEAPAKPGSFEIKPYALGSVTTNRLADPPLSNDPNSEFG